MEAEEAHGWDQNAIRQRDRVDRARDADVRCPLRICVYVSINENTCVDCLGLRLDILGLHLHLSLL